MTRAGAHPLVHRTVELGHSRLAYAGHGAGPESWADRMRGFRDAAGFPFVSIGCRPAHR